MLFEIYRFNPETDSKPHMQRVELDIDPAGKMLLDAILLLKQQDETLSVRYSCREGVCGSDALNVNGQNRLACITPLPELSEPVQLRPLPGLPVIRDLVVDMAPFFRQYEAVKPYLLNHDPQPEIERLQTPEQRDQLDGLYECILCGACTSSCPSFWWHPERFLGPAALLQAYRFIADSRDQAGEERLSYLEDPYRLYRCHSILNCTASCPKGLNPHAAIARTKQLLIKRKL